MRTDKQVIARLVAELRGICAGTGDEAEILVRVRPLLGQAAQAGAEWVEERMFEVDPQQGFGVHVLHEEPNHGLTVMTVSWLPQRGAPPHDHGTWAAVAGVVGDERNDFFARLDDRSQPGYAELVSIGCELCRPGDVVTMPSGVIHSVNNNSAAVTLSLHIYGRHPNYTGRSQFDVEHHSETPFVVRVSA